MAVETGTPQQLSIVEQACGSSSAFGPITNSFSRGKRALQCSPQDQNGNGQKQDYQPNGEFLIAVEIHKHAPLKGIISERNTQPCKTAWTAHQRRQRMFTEEELQQCNKKANSGGSRRVGSKIVSTLCCV